MEIKFYERRQSDLDSLFVKSSEAVRRDLDIVRTRLQFEFVEAFTIGFCADRDTVTNESQRSPDYPGVICVGNDAADDHAVLSSLCLRRPDCVTCVDEARQRQNRC